MMSTYIGGASPAQTMCIPNGFTIREVEPGTLIRGADGITGVVDHETAVITGLSIFCTPENGGGCRLRRMGDGEELTMLPDDEMSNPKPMVDGMLETTRDYLYYLCTLSDLRLVNEMAAYSARFKFLSFDDWAKRRLVEMREEGQ